MADNLVSSLGAGSGIDTQSLVTNLVAFERKPLDDRLANKQTKLEAQISAYGAMKSALSDFQGILKPLQDAQTFSARSVSFSESTTVTPTKVDPNAITGNYQVEITQLARVQSLSTAKVSDTKAALGTGTLDIRFGSWGTGFTANTARDALKIEIDASNNTLEGIRDAINKTNSGIQASIMKDGSEYRLLIASPSGETNALEVTATETTPGLSIFNYNGSSKSLTQSQAAQDAVLKLNGLEVHRDSNEIKDLIAGLEFTANKASPGEIINFSVTEDKQTGEKAIRDFVEAYNTFYKFAKGVVGVSRDDKNQTVKGDLSSDSIAKSITNRLREVMLGAVPGLQGSFSALANVGVQTNLDGTLSIDETKFKGAINTNFEAVAGLFSPKLSSDAALITAEKGSLFASTKPGVYDVQITHSATKGVLTAAEAATYDFTTPLDASAKDYSFKINVNGAQSALISLPSTKTYASLAEVATDLQDMINSDTTLRAAKAGVDVSISGGKLVFTSRDYGSSSRVAISDASAGMTDDLGIDNSGSAQTGTDVAGTINGVAGFGAGNVLLPALNTDATGMSFTVTPGATSAKVTVSQGLAGELSKFIDNVLGRTGSIKTREDSLNREMGVVKDDKEKLNTRMSMRLAQLQSQFLQMERIVSSFKSTGLQLEGMLGSLPFTSKN